MKANLFAVCVLLSSITLTFVGARFDTECCPVCEKEVFVVSKLEKWVGPFKDIPVIHPICADYLKREIAPREGKTMNQWLRERGYYYSSEQWGNLGIGPATMLKDHHGPSQDGSN